ncbi:MAG TPA: hypothetical protein VH684_29705 [Xanthobacteraceae bacterium]
MPRYFFNMVEGDGRDLVRDSGGVVLSDPGAAHKQAAALARDIVRHGFQSSIETWNIVVTDEAGEQLLILPLSDVPAKSSWTWLEPHSLIARCKDFFGTGPAARFAAAAGIGIMIQAAFMVALMITNGAGTYQTASAPVGDAIVAVRFIPQASPDAIGEFVERYKATIMDHPRAAGFYRLRLTDPHLRKEELTKTVSRMMAENIVELAAAVE